MGLALRLLLAVRLLLLPTAGSWPGMAAPKAPSEDCGQQLFFDISLVSRIIGGHDAPKGAWPWCASLQVRQAKGYFAHICGGVLINEKSVLTAAHCVTGRTLPYLWQAVLGVHNLYKPSKHMVSLRIRRIAVHPAFEQDVLENDLAFFELASAARLSAYIQPICLPPAQPLPAPQNQTRCFISGWGLTAEKGQGSAVLKEAQVEIIPLSICKRSSSYGRLVNNNTICAGSPMGGVDSCLGDSGGPLACYHASTNRFHLTGITSFGVGCGRQRFPGVYVRVSQYRKWITGELLKNRAVNPMSAGLAVLLPLVLMMLR